MAAICAGAANVLRISSEQALSASIPPAPGRRSTVEGAACDRSFAHVAGLGCTAPGAHTRGASERRGRAARCRTRAEHRDACGACRSGAARRSRTGVRSNSAVPGAARRVAALSRSSQQRVPGFRADVRVDCSFPRSASHPAHEFRRASQGLSSLENLVDWPLAASSRQEWIVLSCRLKISMRPLLLRIQRSRKQLPKRTPLRPCCGCCCPSRFWLCSRF